VRQSLWVVAFVSGLLSLSVIPLVSSLDSVFD
jgi:hypothetical protein